MRQVWYKNVYRRNVVDMHITDVDERFMGQFDAARYVDLLGEPFSFEMDAPKCVEIALFDDREERRLIVHLINLQKELPNIPVEGIRVRVRLNGREPGRLLVLPEGSALPYTLENGCAAFTAPRLETHAMFALTYQA